MPTVHIFNPEHDIALAYNLERFTPPKAGRQLRHDLGFLPMLWAEEDDMILVDDKDVAIEALSKLPLSTKGQLVTHGELKDVMRHMDASVVGLAPWGWDAAIANQLERAGIPRELLPSPTNLDCIRAMSHRNWAAEHILSALETISNDIVGTTWNIQHLDEVDGLQEKYGRLMMKQPWSSSGRGVRQVSKRLRGCQSKEEENLERWILKTIHEQGSIMAEPLYDKVEDFGMEFRSNGQGNIEYCGLSLFQTVNGAYSGNWIAAEEEKMQHLLSYGLPLELFQKVIDMIIGITSRHFHEVYCGPFGVDMMIVNHQGRLKLHPCVELNLRCTMGHVALALSHKLPDYRGTMRIDYTGTYQFLIDSTFASF